MPSMQQKTAILFGASGLVGGHLLRLLASESLFDTVISVGRRAVHLAEEHRASVYQISWEDLARSTSSAGPIEVAPGLTVHAEAVFIALGTTMKQAGSREAFRKVDLDLVLHAAKDAKRCGAKRCYVVSAIGADAGSRIFYNRVKGEAETALGDVGFERLTIFRPSLLLGHRPESRPAETMGQIAGRLVGPLMAGPLARFRPVLATDVAQAMVTVETLSAETTGPESGAMRIVESDGISRIARLRGL